MWTRGHWPLRITWLRSLFFFVQVCEGQKFVIFVDFKLQLLFFYVSAFHILMHIFTFRLYVTLNNYILVYLRNITEM
jgi:hypothetical protein